MKKIARFISIIAVVLLSVIVTACTSGQGVGNYYINQSLYKMPPDVKQQLGNFKFYFGYSDHENVKELGLITVSSRDSHYVNAQDSCQYAFYTALIKLKIQAEKLGANAVSNVQSIWNDNKISSKSIYVCEDSSSHAEVVLRGTAIKQ